MSSGEAERQFDLEERTARFGESLVTFRPRLSRGEAVDCGSLLPLCGGRSLLRVGRSIRAGRLLRATGSRLPSTTAAAGCRSPRRGARRQSSPQSQTAAEKAKEKSRKARAACITHCSLVIPYSFTPYSLLIPHE